MTAVVQVVIREPRDPYVLNGLVWCGRCDHPMVGTHAVDRNGQRVYSCGQTCEQADLPAVQAESDLLLNALIRAAVVTDATDEGDSGRLAVSAEELHRWQVCDPRDRRAVLHAAYVKVLVNGDGQLRPYWRHRANSSISRADVGGRSGAGRVP